MATEQPPANVESSRRVPLDLLVTGDNPRRKKPEDTYIEEIAASMRALDVIEPLIVRPHTKESGKLQIVCGETRYVAAQRAGLANVPVVIRPYNDEQVLEVQLVENIQRNAMHPVDEGEAFKRLIDKKLHSVESLAKRIGKSERWVWNRLAFTKLIPSLKEAFLKDELNASHAELLTRLEPADQKRIDNPSDEREGVWRWDYLDLDPTTPSKAKEEQRRSVRSVRDINDWIESNVRLAIGTEAVQNLLPEIEEVQLEAAREQTRVLQVATVFLLPQDPQLKKRFEGVLTDRHWKRAGGKSACEFAEKAVIVFGDGQGEVLDVCVNKKQCAKHWPDHQPAAKTKHAGQASNDPYRKGTPAYEARIRREQAAAAEGERLVTRWKAFKPALERSVLAAAGKLPVAGELYRHALAAHRLPLNTKAAELPRALLLDAVQDAFHHAYGYHAEKTLVAWAKRLGVDVKKVESSIAVNVKAMKQDDANNRQAKGITNPKELKAAVKPAVARHAKRTAAQRKAVSDRMRKYWKSKAGKKR